MIFGFFLILGAVFAQASWEWWCFTWFLVGVFLDLERKEKS